MKKIFLLATVVVMALSACNHQVEEQTTDSTPIAMPKGVWDLQTFNGDTIVPIEGEDVPTILFNETDSLVSGFAGCNSYHGKYILGENGAISINNMGWTMMMCSEEAMAFETKFVGALEGVDHYELNDNAITLTAGDSVCFKFVQRNNPNNAE